MAVDIKEVVRIIESGGYFSCELITANINKGSGGKVIVIAKAKIARNQASSISHNAGKKINDKISKNPNHRKNFTRNIELPGKDILTIHPALVFKINNQFVI